MFVLSLLAVVAFAEIPASVRPIAAPAYAVDEYRQWAASRRGDELVCERIVDEVLVCFQHDDGDKRRWVGTADLAAWKVARDAFVVEMRARAASQVRLEAHAADDLAYWTTGDADRWALAALLAPAALGRAADSEALHLTVPLERTVLVWKPDSAELDQVMAVGAAEMTQTQPGAVSPVVLELRDGQFRVYGQAVAGQPSADGRTPR